MKQIKNLISSHLYDKNSFRVIYILSLFFTSVCFIEPLCQVATGVLMLWALFILSNKIINKDFIKNTKFFWLLASVITSSLITALIHLNDNFGMNLLMVYHVIICFFIFYGLHSKSDKNKIQAELTLIFKIIVISATALSIAGIIFSVLFAKVEFLGFHIGLRDNRYTGFYTNPNLSAFSSTIAIICCHFLLNKKDSGDKNIISKSFAIICFVSNALSILLSDSNASLLFIISYLIIYCFYISYKKNKLSSMFKIIVNNALLLIICTSAALGVFSLRGACQLGVANFMNTIHHTEFDNYTGEEGSEDDFTIDIGRKQNHDVSSGRIDSLQKAMILYEKNPLMGIGKGNIVEYGNRYLAKGFKFFDLHNGYLTILISCGAVGFIIFMLFAICVAFKMLNHLKNINDTDDNRYPILFAAIAAYSIFALFERALLLDITFMVVIFWVFLGHAMNYVVLKEKDTHTEFNINKLLTYLPGMTNNNSITVNNKN